MSKAPYHYDVIIIGAGPSGAVAASLIHAKGHKVLVLERETFPRFSIGESLLPQCMEYLDEAGMLEAIAAAGFQRKNGAMFQRAGHYSGFDFSEQFSSGWGETYQVRRAEFDTILADEAAAQGVEIRYGHEIVSVSPGRLNSQVLCKGPDAAPLEFSARFLLDASGFGRVLPRLLGLEKPVDFPLRASLFTHVEDNISSRDFDRDKILITVHPSEQDVWYWLIPFADGRSSVGVVARPQWLAQFPEAPQERLRAIVAQDAELTALLQEARWDTPARQISGYAAKATPLATDQYALLGNAAEFLDPVFSSGVTIALRSASMASAAVDRLLCGERVDWEHEYSRPLAKGVDTFRAFVNAWYDGRFQEIIFHPGQSPEIRKMLCSILAGYAWDERNPYVSAPERRLNTLSQYCSQAVTSA